jgi:hypothetical protein
MAESADVPRVAQERLKAFVARVFTMLGLPAHEANVVADLPMPKSPPESLDAVARDLGIAPLG